MKEYWDLICSSYDGDRMYFQFKMLYYAVRYVKLKAKFKFEKQVDHYCDVRIYIYIYDKHFTMNKKIRSKIN